MRPGGGEGQSGAGEPCGDTGAREGPRRPARGAPAARARAGRRQPRLAGRTRRRAAPRRVLRLESPPPSAARRVQPSSPAARAAAGGLSQHLPAVSHTPLRDPGGGFAHTRAPTAARSLRSQKSKIQNQEMRGDEESERGWRRCADSGVSWQRRGGRAPPGSEAKSVSRSGEARSARAAAAGPASGARAAPAAWGTTQPPALPHMSGLLARGVRGLCGRRRRGTRGRGKRREEQGRAAPPMHSRRGRLVPSTITKNPPVSSRWRSGTSACVCV